MIVTDSVPQKPSPKESISTSLIITFILTLFIGVVAWLVILPTVVPGIILGMVFVVGAIPYTVVASIFAFRNRLRARKAVANGEYNGERPEVEAFQTRWQQMTLVLNVLLSLTFVAMLIATINELVLPSGGLEGRTYLVGGLVLPFAILMIKYNSPFIYRSKDIQAEEYALQQHTAESKYILVNRAWSWATWFAYSILSLLILVTVV